MKQRGIKPVIPPKSNRTKPIRYSKRLYRQRNCIERVLGHLKINRAIATRYDQLAESFLGMLFIALLSASSDQIRPRGLALQLHFRFEVGAACFGLVSSSPE